MPHFTEPKEIHKNMTELTAYMPVRIKTERQKMLNLAARCQVELNQAFRKFDVPKPKSVPSYTCDSVVECSMANRTYAISTHLYAWPRATHVAAAKSF